MALAACEQTGRSAIPKILSPLPLSQWLSDQEKQTETLRLILTPVKAQNINHLNQKPSSIIFMVGPEGGFSEKEMALASHSAFIPVNFGERILRTETASIVALSIMQNLWGDFA